MSDVEPDDTPEEIAERERRQAELLPFLIENMGNEEPIPPVSEPEPVAASSTAPVDVTPSMTVGVPVASSSSIEAVIRKPTRPNRPHAPAVCRLRNTVPVPQPIPQQPEAVQHARRRLKSVSSLHMANATTNFRKSTDPLAQEFAARYSLKPEERYQVRREMSKMRLAQKAFALRIGQAFPLNCHTDTQCDQFLDWLESESRLATKRYSDSDGNDPNQGNEG